VAHGPPAAPLAAAPPVPGLSDEALRAAASAPGLEAAVDALAAGGCTLAGALREALPRRDRAGLAALEVAADRAAYARALGAARSTRGEDAALVLRHVEDRVDACNARTLVALASAPPVDDPWVRGGRRLPEPELRALAGAPPADVRRALARAFPGPEAALALPWSADRALERALVASLRREARRSPLSIAVPLAYLAERRAEVRRAAVVLRGASLGLPGDELLDLAEA
jgi:V/A-type H+-transporting ATPase subunit C